MGRRADLGLEAPAKTEEAARRGINATLDKLFPRGTRILIIALFIAFDQRNAMALYPLLRWYVFSLMCRAFMDGGKAWRAVQAYYR